MSRSSGFWNLIAPMYAKQAVSDQASYARKLAETQALMRPDMNVLDFGCGTGSTALTHAPHVGQITGIDYSHKMIAIAQEKIGSVPNLSFHVSTLTDWDAPDGSYDMILGLNILHLMPDYQDALAKAHRLFKPGGYLVTSTVCMGEFAGVLKYLLPVLSSLRITPVIAMFSTDKLQADIKAAGFTKNDSWQPDPKGAVFQISQKPI